MKKINHFINCENEKCGVPILESMAKEKYGKKYCDDCFDSLFPVLKITLKKHLARDGELIGFADGIVGKVEQKGEYFELGLLIDNIETFKRLDKEFYKNEFSKGNYKIIALKGDWEIPKEYEIQN